jgi:HAD superfamily hydrolase (TIGR01549 family)
MKEKSYSAWLCDLDGTLFRLGPVRLLMAGEALMLGAAGLRTLRRFRIEHERLRAERHEAQNPFQTQVERTARSLGVDPAKVDAVVREWMLYRPGKWLRLFRRRGLLAEIHQYRAAGGRTALVSDYPATVKLEALGARALFDAVVANGEPGGPTRLKPDPQGYLLAAHRLGVEPGSCLVIGDREDADGLAAQAAGMAFRKVG